MDTVDPDSTNFRGGAELTLGGALFVPASTGSEVLECAFDGVATGAATFVSASEVRCEAPAGEAGTQVDVSLWIGGRRYTTSPGRLFYEADPAEVSVGWQPAGLFDAGVVGLVGCAAGNMLAVAL